MKIRWLILISISVFALSSCEKDSGCETWEVMDECTETGNCNYVGCNSFPSGVQQVELCGSQLDDAQPNKTITINNNCVVRQRTFLRKL